MKKICDMNKSELELYRDELTKKYEGFKDQKLNYDMSRGKPGPGQLDLALGILDAVNSHDGYKALDGTDGRNYGGVDGLPEVKQLFAQMLEVKTSEIIIGGNSSLNLMYDTIARAMVLGVLGSEKPWSKYDKIKFLCPSPGYDRHFAICEHFGIEMITIDMKKDGPDMDQVEALVGSDDSIKGIWCVPKYSNPDGITYSDEVVNRFAKMKTKATDFRIFWDNAYIVHHLSNNQDKLKNILKACEEVGNNNRVFIFSSTSKISFPGAGISMLASSEANVELIKKQLTIQTIGPDKLNQLRHVKYFKNIDGIEEHMKKQAEVLQPKFQVVLEILDQMLGGKEIAFWNKPNGGYFISLNTLPNCAKKVVAMAKEAGVVLTNAGATFPYGKDPLDRNIRIAPTFPELNELKQAIELLCICVELASVELTLK